MNKELIIPKRLKKGDVIGIIAPSDSIQEKDEEEIKNSVELMEKSGFKIEFGKFVRSNSLEYSASPEEKAYDINNMFLNQEIKAIFCVKGGENSNTVFDYLDYNIIKNNPKILCGFSDSTSVTNVINLKTGLVTFNGPTFKSLTSWDTNYGYKEVIKRFVDGSLELGTNDDNYFSIINGNAEGILIGGNISLLYGMVAGKYALDFKDKILFIEELGYESSPTRVSNMLTYFKQNGVFEEIKGIWVGNYEHETSIELEKILLDVIGNSYKKPIIKSNNFGHTDRKTVIPIGTMAKIDTSLEKKIELIEKCVI